MEEDECDDELPPISVNCSSKEESVFSMPSAEVLASQRAREEQCERELREMREQHERQQADLTAVENGSPTMPSRSNSSSSEGETALTCAVEALRVGNSPADGPQRPAAADVLSSVAAQLPAGARALCQDYAAALQRAGARDVDALTDELVTGIGAWVCGFDVETARLECAGEERADSPLQNPPSDDEVVGVGAWLCSAAVWRAPAAHRARCRRALHALLAAATTQQVNVLSVVMVRAVRGARSRLELAAAAAAAGREPRAHALAAALCRAALADLLHGERPESGSCVTAGALSLAELAELARRGWRALAARRRDVALQLLGRALAAAKLQARALDQQQRAALDAALAALAQPLPTAPHDRNQPDHLKIAVAASKLQILLSDRN